MSKRNDGIVPFLAATGLAYLGLAAAFLVVQTVKEAGEATTQEEKPDPVIQAVV